MSQGAFEFNFEHYFESSMDFVCVIDFDFNMLAINPALSKAMGAQDPSSLKTLADLLHPDDLAMSLEKAEALKSGSPVFLFECRLKSQSTDYLWTSWTAVADFEKKQILAVGRDISAIKINEGKRESRFRRILERAPGGLYICNPGRSYAFTHIQDQLESLGYEPEQLMGSPGFWMSQVHPEDQAGVLDELDSLFEKENGDFQYRVRAQDGNYHWVRDLCTLVRDKSGEPVEIIGFWSDVTK